ncbi:MAG TPA: ABC transporter permease [Dehalococcoidia bacterium]|nr:ABC transporter permease [Dehalococcoidia bacterium]
MRSNRLAAEATIVEEALRPKPSRLQGALSLARQKPLGAASLVIIVVLVVVAVLAPLLAPYDPYQVNYGARLAPPGSRFLFGADGVGRDVLSRVIFGARISLYVGVTAVTIGTLGASILGLICGFWGGKLDFVIQRFVDAKMCFPAIILALALMTVLGASINNVVIAIAIVIIPGDSRIVRGAVLSVKENPYIEAARCLGASNWRIILRHILPNVTAPILIMYSAWLGAAILTEASLSFLGLGTPPPMPSWGGMLSGEGRRNMEQAPWLAIFPGLAISMTIFAFNLFGDAVRDVWDPRLRGTR